MSENQSKGLERKFINWDHWDVYGVGHLAFYIEDKGSWTDYSKQLIKSQGKDPKDYTIFELDMSNSTASFVAFSSDTDSEPNEVASTLTFDVGLSVL